MRWFGCWVCCLFVVVCKIWFNSVVIFIVVFGFRLFLCACVCLLRCCCFLGGFELSGFICFGLLICGWLICCLWLSLVAYSWFVFCMSWFWMLFVCCGYFSLFLLMLFGLVLFGLDCFVSLVLYVMIIVGVNYLLWVCIGYDDCVLYLGNGCLLRAVCGEPVRIGVVSVGRFGLLWVVCLLGCLLIVVLLYLLWWLWFSLYCCYDVCLLLVEFVLIVCSLVCLWHVDTFGWFGLLSWLCLFDLYVGRLDDCFV